jgi:Spy/CpxP family protein refolding chaperone
MKKATIAILAIALISTGALLIFAQKGDGMRRGPRGGGFGPGHGLLMMADKIGATEEQKTRIKAILEDSKTRVQPLMEALRANHEAIRNLGTDGTYNEAEVARIANAQAETTKQLIVEKEKTKAAIFAVLTPEQRTKATELREQMKERFKGRFPGGFRGPKGPGPMGDGIDE